MDALIKFLDSNTFVALVTLVVGFFAIYIYMKQQRDKKRAAANTILLEIKNAEKLLDSAKKKIGKSRRSGATRIPEHHYVMPKESWSLYKGVLAKDIPNEQWDKVAKFYNDCQLFDEAIAYNDAMFINDTAEIRKNVHQGIYKYVSEYFEKIMNESDENRKLELLQELQEKKDGVSKLLTDSNFMYTYIPNKPIRDIELLIDTIDTSLAIGEVGQKLQKISSGHWWW